MFSECERDQLHEMCDIDVGQRAPTKVANKFGIIVVNICGVLMFFNPFVS